VGLGPGSPELRDLLLALKTKMELLATTSATNAEHLGALQDQGLPIPRYEAHEFAEVLVARYFVPPTHYYDIFVAVENV